MFSDLAAEVPPLKALGKMLAHAQRTADLAAGADTWLCRFFGVERQHDLPVAPYACLGDGIEPEGFYWLRADPVHFHLQNNRVTLADSTLFDISLDEAQQCVTALNDHFSGDGMEFIAPHANRWYLRLESFPGIITHTLEDANGQDVDRLMPQGEQAARWHTILNEMQMLLHTHPVNLQREERGELPVNSVWLWGGGILPQSSPLGVAGIWAEDALVRGLSLANGQAAGVVPFSCNEWLERSPADGGHLIILDALEQADLRNDNVAWREALVRLESHWFVPLLEALQNRKLASVHLHFAELHRVVSVAVVRTDLWKFWRQPKSLQALLES